MRTKREGIWAANACRGLGIDPGLGRSASGATEPRSRTVRLCVSQLPAARAQRKCSASDLTNPRTMGVQCVRVSTTKDVWLVVS